MRSPIVAPETSVSTAISLMSNWGLSCVLVVEGSAMEWGIFPSTDRQSSLEEPGERLRKPLLLADTTPDIIYLYDIQKRRNVYTNEQLTELLDHPAEVAQKEDTHFFIDALHPEDALAWRQLQERLSTAKEGEAIEGEAIEREYRLRTANGSWRWFRSRHGIFSRDAAGAPEQILVIGEDITDIVREREALHQSEQKLGAVIANSPVMLLEIDKEGTITSAEGKILNAGELVGRNFFQLSLESPEAIAKLSEIISNSQNLEAMYELPLVGEPAEINSRIHKWRYAPLIDSLGELTGAVCVGTEIANSKKTEAELRSLFAAMTDVVLVLNREGRYLRIAPTKTEMLYKTPAQFLGKTIAEVFPAEQAEFFLSRIRAALDSKQTVKIEYSLPIGGNEVWFEAKISPMSQEEAIVVARDITERKKNERKLKDLEQFWQQIVNANPDPIFVKDDRHQYIILNEASCELLGQSRENLIGKSDHEIFTQEIASRLRKTDEMVLASGISSENEVCITDASGKSHVISTKKSLFVDASGDKFIIGTIRDITGRVAAEEALKKSEERYRAFVNRVSEAIYCLEFDRPISIDRPEEELVRQIVQTSYIAECNDVMAQMYGLGSGAEMVGKRIGASQPPNQIHNGDGTRALIRSGYRLSNVESQEVDKLGNAQYFLNHLVGIVEEGLLRRIWVTKLDITERKKTQIALRTSEERYRGIIESQQELIVRVDLEGRFTFVNDACWRKLGCDARALIGRSFTPLVHPEDLPAALEVMQGEPPARSSLELRLLTPEGWCWIAWESCTIRDERSIPQEIQVVGRDISDRKATSVALRESQNRLELFFSQSLEGFFFMMLDSPVRWDDTVDKDKVLDYVFAHQRITKVNDAMLAQYGASREQFTGLTPKQFFAHDLALGKEVWRRLFDKGRLTIEINERRLDGTPIWIEGEYICLYNDEGNIIGHFGVQRDITERHLAQEALRESEQRFRQIAENIQEIFWVASADLSDLLYVSPAYEKIWGRSCYSAYESSIWLADSIHPDDRDRIVAPLGKSDQKYDQKHDQKHDSISREYRIVRPDGAVRWVGERIFPIRDEQGNVYRRTGIVADITERKQASLEIHKALEQERELSELKTRFITTASHEFRTPLATILSSADMLEFYAEQENAQKSLPHIERIQTAAIHLTTMLEEILVMGQAESIGMEFDPKPVDLPAFCRSIVEEVKAIYPLGPPIAFVAQSSSDADPSAAENKEAYGALTEALVDEKLLRQIMVNLLLNAIEYSPAGERVQFELIPQAQGICFRIQDAGIGIEIEDLPRLFDRFYRGKNVGNIPGTGLGLAIVKNALDVHGGEIAVESEVGVGTTFTVTLPLSE